MTEKGKNALSTAIKCTYLCASRLDNDKFLLFLISHFIWGILCVHTLDTTWSVRLRHKWERLVSHNKFHNVNAHFFYFNLLFFSFTCAFLKKLNQLWTFVISTCFPFRINCGHILSFQFHHKKVFFYFIFLMMWRLFMSPLLSIHVPDFWSSRFHKLLISINQWITNGSIILYISCHLGLLMNYSQT